jgi:hypothetical protein
MSLHGIIDRFKLACRAVTALQQPDGEAQLEALASQEGYKPHTLRCWLPVAKLFTEEQFEVELAVRCENGEELRWSHFDALGPLVVLPVDKARLHAHEVLDLARQGLGARELAKRARAIARKHKDALIAGPSGEFDDRHDCESLDGLRAEVVDLRREVRELRQEVGCGQRGTAADDDQTLHEDGGRPEQLLPHEDPATPEDDGGGRTS